MKLDWPVPPVVTPFHFLTLAAYYLLAGHCLFNQAIESLKQFFAACHAIQLDRIIVGVHISIRQPTNVSWLVQMP